MPTSWKNLPKDLYSQAGVLALVSLFWIPFLFSAWEYTNETWFSYLLISRWVAFVFPILAIVYVIYRRQSVKGLEQHYFILTMLMQASHGFLESKTENEFYTYISLFALFFALTYKGSSKKWFFVYLPIIAIAHLVPLSVKDPSFFASFAYFVDKFTVNIVLLALAFLNTRISINTHKLHQRLLEEKDNRLSIVERELALAKDKLVSQAHNKALVSIASKVAHDIRSPLAALKLVSNNSKVMTDKKMQQLLKESIDRVEGIAEELLSKRRSEDKENSTGQYMSVLAAKKTLKNIISEKSVCYQFKSHITWGNKNGAMSMDELGFYRCLSNLVQNSLEAKARNLKLELSEQDKFYKITLKDDGLGIPDDVLKYLGKKEITHGKRNGNGLGIISLKSYLEKQGGLLNVQSAVGKGTTVSLTVPKATIHPEFNT